MTMGDFDLATQITTEIVNSQIKATEEEFRIAQPFKFNGVSYTFDGAKELIQNNQVGNISDAMLPQFYAVK